MAGAPPKLNPARSNPRVGVVVLPASGRVGDPPPWPIGEPDCAEAGLWADLWRTPQACAWERFGWTRLVARYCLVVLAAEGGRSDGAMDAGALAEARQLEDRLGLSPKAMRLLLWVVSDDVVGERRDAKAATPARSRRLRAVDA